MCRGKRLTLFPATTLGILSKQGNFRTESSVFASMLDIPQDGTDVSTEVRLTEDSLVLGLITAFVSALPLHASRMVHDPCSVIGVNLRGQVWDPQYGTIRPDFTFAPTLRSSRRDPLALYIFVRNHGWEEFLLESIQRNTQNQYRRFHIKGQNKTTNCSVDKLCSYALFIKCERTY